MPFDQGHSRSMLCSHCENYDLKTVVKGFAANLNRPHSSGAQAQLA